MNEEHRDLDRRVVNNSSRETRDSLVERLDPALGEASSGIGVLLSELVRRTLRGGVSKIEEEMQGFVEEKVDLVVASRMPEFEAAAAQTAEVKARDVVRQEVETVEQQARKIDEEAKAAAERLAGEIAETERRVQDKTRVIEQESKAAAEKLGADIAETERRARELVAQQIEDLKQKSKGTYVQLRESLDELDARAAALRGELAQEQKSRAAALGELRQAIDASLQQHVRELSELVSQLRAENALLELRVVELEKPRGLRALFHKLFGRKKKPPAAPQVEASADG